MRLSVPSRAGGVLDTAFAIASDTGLESVERVSAQLRGTWGAEGEGSAGAADPRRVAAIESCAGDRGVRGLRPFGARAGHGPGLRTGTRSIHLAHAGWRHAGGALHRGASSEGNDHDVRRGNDDHVSPSFQHAMGAAVDQGGRRKPERRGGTIAYANDGNGVAIFGAFRTRLQVEYVDGELVGRVPPGGGAVALRLRRDGTMDFINWRDHRVLRPAGPTVMSRRPAPAWCVSRSGCPAAAARDCG